MRYTPQTENELVDLVRAARAQKLRFEILGRGTKRALGRAIDTDAILDLSAFAGILRYEPDELVITARAATPVAEIESVVAERNQRIGFEPADWSALYGTQVNNATIGGVLSSDASGSARLKFGAARDHLLGYRAANGWGEIYKAGGRVVKNVTGFDMAKLMCGAMGTLGPLTEVTLRLVPRQPDSVTHVVRNVSAETGLALLRRAWSSPLEPSGLAYMPRETSHAFSELGEIGEGAALFRFDGARAPLADKIEAMKALTARHDLMHVEAREDVFTRIGSGAAFARETCDVWRVFVPPSAAEATAHALAQPLWIADWAGGVLWVGGGEPEAVHAIAEKAGGYAVLMRADDASRRRRAVYSPEPPARAALTRRVKTAFDPDGLFNPGRIFDGI